MYLSNNLGCKVSCLMQWITNILALCSLGPLTLHTLIPPPPGTGTYHNTQHNFYILPIQIRISPAVTMAEIFVASWWAADLGSTFTVSPTCSISEDSTSEQAVPSQSHNPSFLHCFFFFLKEQAFGSLLTPYPWPFCAPLAVPSSYLPLSAPPWMKERTHHMSRRMWNSDNESQSTRWAYLFFAGTFYLNPFRIKVINSIG